MTENRIQSALRFYYLATQLKYKIRSGWDNDHWQVKGRRESVADHVYGTCILAISIASEFNCDIDLNKVLKMMVLHEIGEVLIGDITPYDGMSQEDKYIKEHKAIEKMVDGLIAAPEIISLLEEFDEHKTKESVFAFHCDKLEANLQSNYYQEAGQMPKLRDKNGNISSSIRNHNVAYKKSQEIRNIFKKCNTTFDVWYEADKAKFQDDVVFSQMLDYIHEHSVINEFNLKPNKALK